MAGATLEPTAAQLSCVKNICDQLNIDEPEKLTRKCYSDFITEHKDQMYNERARLRNTDKNFIFCR